MVAAAHHPSGMELGTTATAVGVVGVRRNAELWAAKLRRVRSSSCTCSRRTPVRLQAAREGGRLGASVALADMGAAHAGQVFLTREENKNGKLKRLLNDVGIDTFEMPLVTHTREPGAEELVGVLQSRSKDFHWVVVTSPEAADVFTGAWRAAGCPKVKVASIGKGTTLALDRTARGGIGSDNLAIGFTPTKANAKTMVKELPLEVGGRVLYPASKLASTDLQDGLRRRGFVVERMNTYATCQVQSLTSAQVDAAKEAKVITFGSPSSVRAWMGLLRRKDIIAACIGSTSADAAKSLGIETVFCPSKPGLEGWVQAVRDALEHMQLEET